METEAQYDRSPSIGDVEDWLALGAGTFLLVAGVFRRSAIGACLAVSSTPLLYRGITAVGRKFSTVPPGPTVHARPSRASAESMSGNLFAWKCRSPTPTVSGDASTTCRSS
jgi:hypothetical protein